MTSMNSLPNADHVIITLRASPKHMSC